MSERCLPRILGRGPGKEIGAPETHLDGFCLGEL